MVSGALNIAACQGKHALVTFPLDNGIDVDEGAVPLSMDRRELGQARSRTGENQDKREVGQRTALYAALLVARIEGLVAIVSLLLKNGVKIEIF